MTSGSAPDLASPFHELLHVLPRCPDLLGDLAVRLAFSVELCQRLGAHIPESSDLSLSLFHLFGGSGVRLQAGHWFSSSLARLTSSVTVMVSMMRVGTASGSPSHPFPVMSPSKTITSPMSSMGVMCCCSKYSSNAAASHAQEYPRSQSMMPSPSQSVHSASM